MFVITDLASLAPDRRDLGQWSVYAICDGHGGSNAAKFVRRHLGSALVKVLPAGNPPPIQSEDSEKFCELVRHALVKAFVSLHDAFSSEGCRTSGIDLQKNTFFKSLFRDNVVGLFGVWMVIDISKCG